MTAEMFNPEMTPEKPENELNKVIGQRAIEFADVHLSLDGNESDIREEIDRARNEFVQVAYDWQSETIDELFDRIAGAEQEPSDELRNKMLLDLYTNSKLLEDEDRPSYKEVFGLFARQALTISQIEEALQSNGDRDIRNRFVQRHILTTIRHISRHKS